MFPIRDHNPSTRLAIVTYGLIATNVIIHLIVMVSITTDRALFELYGNYALIPSELSSGRSFPTLITSTFLHGDLLHLAGNMLFLFIFGDNLEDTLGHFGFLAFYLICGAGAALAQWISDPWSPIPTIGASGAIAGVMGGYLLLFPKAKVDIFIFLIFIIRIIPVPAWLMLGLWFLLQIVGGVGADPDTGGIAYWAHAGGFVIGLVLMVPVWLYKGGTDFWDRNAGHPPHPDKDWGKLSQSRIPKVRQGP
jgi:membrane associated rhomboid family serine protease